MKKRINPMIHLGLIAGLLATTENEYGKYGMPKKYREYDVEPDQKIIGNSKKTEKEKAEMNGLKEFDFNGNKVYALNKKNADKKAKKVGYIL